MGDSKWTFKRILEKERALKTGVVIEDVKYPNIKGWQTLPGEEG